MTRVFFDTNIIAYTYDVFEPEKYKIASSLLLRDRGTISTQVLSELTNLLFKKFHYPWSDINSVYENLTRNLDVRIFMPSTIRKAIALADRYKFQYYDSLILAAAIESSSSVLYSEDFQDSQEIEGVRIINPFA